jgi:hypothetical protein
VTEEELAKYSLIYVLKVISAQNLEVHEHNVGSIREAPDAGGIYKTVIPAVSVAGQHSSFSEHDLPCRISFMARLNQFES